MPRYSPKRRYPASYYKTETAPTVKDPSAPATEKQVAFLLSLSVQRDIGMSPEDADVMIKTLQETGGLTKGFVSQQIGTWKECPRRESKQAGPGYYEYEGDLYVVVENRAKTHTYAKKLVNVGNQAFGDHWTWDYEAAKGVATRLAGATPLTEEKAAEWGHLHGRCFKCLKPLTDPESVKRGYGPVCAKALAR